MQVEISRVSHLIREVVETEILPRFRNLSPDDIRSKSHPGDLVTEADTKAERALENGLKALLPGSEVLGEEAVYENPLILDTLKKEVPVWVIDPVDGTGNFVRGNTEFACVVALVFKGVTVAGWIDACVEKRTYAVQKGQGITFPDDIDDSGVSPSPAPETLRGQVGGESLRRKLGSKVGEVGWVGSAARTYLNLIRGKIDFAAFTRLNVWDHAAGVLMVQETASGVGQLVSKEAYSPLLRTHNSPLLLARNEDIWNTVAQVIKGSN